jgi:hypothetical protein
MIVQLLLLIWHAVLVTQGRAYSARRVVSGARQYECFLVDLPRVVGARKASRERGAQRSRARQNRRHVPVGLGRCAGDCERVLTADLIVKERRGTKLEDMENHELETIWESPNEHMGRSFVTSFWAWSYVLSSKAYLYWVPDETGTIAQGSMADPAVDDPPGA